MSDKDAPDIGSEHSSDAVKNMSVLADALSYYANDWIPDRQLLGPILAAARERLAQLESDARKTTSEDGSDYMRGRLDERRAIIGWLRAEADDEALPLYANAFTLAYQALSNIADTSETFGLSIRPIP